MTSIHQRELYACGLVLGAESGAFVAFEKCPRKTGRAERGLETYEDVLTLGFIERLGGSMTSMLERVAAILDSDPLHNDAVTYAETSALGRTLPRILAERGALVGSVCVAGDVERLDPKTGEWLVAPSILQAQIRLALEAGRVVSVNELTEGGPLLRELENLSALPESGPARELPIAAAIAVWAGLRHATNGPWASSKPPSLGSEAAQHFEEVEAMRALAAEKREEQRRNHPWRRRSAVNR